MKAGPHASFGRRADRAMRAAKVAGANASRAWHQLENQAA